jgi:hypothetical protein
MENKKIKKALQLLFFGCLALMLWLYAQGYSNSIGWEVVTSAEVVEYPAIEFEGNLLDFTITGEKYLLTETYSGGEIKRNQQVDAIMISIGWVGLCVVLTAASFLRRYGFLFALALFTLLLNRLNLGEIGLFGIQNRMVIVIPFLAFIAPLFYFHEYRPKTGFLTRIVTLVTLSVVFVLFGVNERDVFLDHFTSHSLFSFSIAGILFLFLIAEENIFGVLLIVTKGKGGKNNLRHFILLSSIYLLNLILYYLNKSGIVPNSFSFFDPFILLALSCIVAYWTIGYKTDFFKKYAPKEAMYYIFNGLGIAFFAMLGLAFYRGNDAIYESYHYFILYFHIGFSVFFFLYLIINFIDPLIQGFEVYKFAYVEQHFPYVSARLGGLVVVLGFYFLSNQEPYNLLKSGYYVNLGNLEETQGNPNLADQYYSYASFLGYNTHHSNYQLAWNYSDKGNEYLTKTHFEKAAARYPSPYAYINYSNLDIELNPVKVQATLAQASQRFKDGEIRNNQGVLRMHLEEWDKALEYFEDAESSDTWNQAPLINKWAAYSKLESMDSSKLENDYLIGNHGVKSNILLNSFEDAFLFEHKNFNEVPILHRHAYLLNAANLFPDDTLASLALNEIEFSTDANFNERLRKSLVIHYYNKGEVNKAFKMMDYLQANSYQYKKGGYLNDMGKLALDQGALKLALDFFDQSSNSDDPSAEINRLEVLARLERGNEIPDELLTIVEKDPGLTNLANQILTNLKEQKVIYQNAPSGQNDLDRLDDQSLIEIGLRNAFDESKVINVVNILNERGHLSCYNIILESIEINPYSAELLKTYAIIALKQNLRSYAESVLPRIRELLSNQEYEQFMFEFEKLKKEIDLEAW